MKKVGVESLLITMTNGGHGFRSAELDQRIEKFFAKHGSKSIVLARFVPIVRTFTPIVAGVSNMHYRTFVKFNVIGGILWGAGITLLGYTLGRAFPAIGENIEIAVVVIVFVSILPVIIEFIRHRRAPKGDHFAE
jgi:membrane-associated protein